MPHLDNVTIAMVTRFNIEHYRKLLAEETDETNVKPFLS